MAQTDKEIFIDAYSVYAEGLILPIDIVYNIAEAYRIGKNKKDKLTISFMRDLLAQFYRGEISFSRMVEIINNKELK